MEAPLLVLMLSVIRPVIEEIVFRGLLQGLCIKQRLGRKVIVGITYANIITSIVFTALHLIYHAPLLALAVFVPSLAFGYFRERYYGWLVPSILLHCFYNTGDFMVNKLGFYAVVTW